MQVGDITPDKLAEVDAGQDRLTLESVFRTSVIAAGKEFRRACQYAQSVELDCMMRARKLAQLSFPKKEIQELFGVDRRTVNRWLKGMENA